MKSAQMRMFAVALLVHAGCGDNPVVEKEGQPWQQRPQHWAPAGTLSFSRTNICDTGGVETPTCDSDCTAAVCGDGYQNVALG